MTENEAEAFRRRMLYETRARGAGVPGHLIDGLVLYLVEGISPGHFLTAVLENNLMAAMSRADEVSRAGLFELCIFLYNDVPERAWGSPARVRAWMEQHATDGASHHA